MNLKQFDILFDNELSIIRLYLFLFLLYIFRGRGKMTNASSSFLRSFYIIGKEKYNKSKQVSLKYSTE